MKRKRRKKVNYHNLGRADIVNLETLEGTLMKVIFEYDSIQNKWWIHFSLWRPASLVALSKHFYKA